MCRRWGCSWPQLGSEKALFLHGPSLLPTEVHSTLLHPFPCLQPAGSHTCVACRHPPFCIHQAPNRLAPSSSIW